MRLEEFAEKNLRADWSIIAFNAKYARKEVFLNANSCKKGKVIGLIKCLSMDGKKPSSHPFLIKEEIRGLDILKANTIILMVNIQLSNIKTTEIVPLHIFYEANSMEQVLAHMAENQIVPSRN